MSQEEEDETHRRHDDDGETNLLTFPGKCFLKKKCKDLRCYTDDVLIMIQH